MKATEWPRASAYQQKKIALHFSKAALQYENAALLQREIGVELMASIDRKSAPQAILDLGCSTGHFSQKLKENFPDAHIIAMDIAPAMLAQAKQKILKNLLLATMEELPLVNNSIDLIFANMSLQWSSDLLSNLFELKRVLKPTGQCLFSVPGPHTLIELKHSWQQVDHSTHVNQFTNLLTIQHHLQTVGFKDIILRHKNYELEYHSVIAMMQHLKATGADCLLSQGHPLTGKTKFKQMIESYEKLRKVNGLLPCTYEITFAEARI